MNQFYSVQEQGLYQALAEIDIRLEKDDFSIINGNYDINKDGLLKILNSIQKYEIDTVIIEFSEKRCIVKATLRLPLVGREGTGLGLATFEEIKSRKNNNLRAEHDMLTLAETRAIKRAIEITIGTAVINSAVKRLFSESEKIDENRKVEGEKTEVEDGKKDKIESERVEKKEREKEMITKFKRAHSDIFINLYRHGFQNFETFKEFYYSCGKWLNSLVADKKITQEEIIDIIGKDRNVMELKPKEVLDVLSRVYKIVMKDAK